MNHPVNHKGELIIPVEEPGKFEGPRHRAAVFGLAGAAVELAKKDELIKEGLIDEVTGLKNRKAFEKHMAEVLPQAKPGDYSFMFIDIDGLKRVNTISYGTGDQYKKTVAESIAESIRDEFRPYDDVFAYGPDEFIVVMHRKYDDPVDLAKHPRDPNDLSKVAARVTSDVDNSIHDIEAIRDVQRLGVSVGWSTLEQGDSLSTMIDRADEMQKAVKAERYAAHAALRVQDPRLL
jgi:diguanylate cyclase (GGDEF)-like protein